MLVACLRRSMSRGIARASHRTHVIAQHMMSTMTGSAQQSESTVLFESNLAIRTYTLNRPSKLNALDEPMLSLLRPKIEEWSASDLCGTIVGTGMGRAFCCGGDVAGVVNDADNPTTRPRAIDFFKREFELDYILATLKKPYVVIMDGHSMGGGYGLAAPAHFRIATEKTQFAMPETKIGYCPDVGASYFMSRMDGELGTYLALTGDILKGRAVFELGFATHYIPSRRVPILLSRLSTLENAHSSVIDRTIEEFSSEREPDEAPTPFIGDIRKALDFAFRHDRVEEIFEDLESFANHNNIAIREWAAETITSLNHRSPTSLKVALRAIRQGKNMTILQALNMELMIATAYCNGASPDFSTGVKAVVVEKNKTERPPWLPTTVYEVSDEIVSRFFDPSSPFLPIVPTLTIPPHLGAELGNRMKYALPTEDEIGSLVRGSHTSGGSTGLRLDELISRFSNLRQGKLGVKEKILEVASRKCEVIDNGDGNFVWLKWKYLPTPP